MESEGQYKRGGKPGGTYSVNPAAAARGPTRGRKGEACGLGQVCLLGSAAGRAGGLDPGGPARQTLRVEQDADRWAACAPPGGPCSAAHLGGGALRIPSFRPASHEVKAAARVTSGARGRASLRVKVYATVDVSHLLKITSAFSRALLRGTDTTDVACKSTRSVATTHQFERRRRPLLFEPWIGSTGETPTLGFDPLATPPP